MSSTMNNKLECFVATSEIDVQNQTDSGRFLMFLRKLVTENEEIRNLLSIADLPSRVREKLINASTLWMENKNHDFYIGIIDEFLKELVNLRDKSHSSYIVDSNTGQIVAPLKPGDIITPPDFIGEDGKIYKARPRLHPEIESALIFKSIELNNLAKAKKLSENPSLKPVYDHLINPESMVESARKKLESMGSIFSESIDSTVEILEFGREIQGADFQSINKQFHRSNMFSSVMATKIFAMCGSSGLFWIGNLEVQRNSKYRWYSVPFKAWKPAGLPSV